MKAWRQYQMNDPAKKKVVKTAELDPSIPRGFASALAESLFIILPLIVLTIVLLQKGKSVRDLFASPEWSFAGAILMGQTMVKLIYGVYATKRRGVNAEWVAVTVAGIIVLGLVPSLIVLSLMLTLEAPSTGM